ncbi:cora-domain-containing protein [Thozetella sp. PMI_491]|nr:cora-domain-containing protein [Thozetella sp. PMI_491]
MSDHEEASGHSGGNSGYSTPVPELDDHRHHHTSSVVRSDHPDRPRRGTFDSLYGARQARAVSPSDLHRTIRVRDFEEAVVDEDGEMSPTVDRRSRRPTVESNRSISPPNSVKAFAEARRQERGMSFSDPKDRKPETEPEFEQLHRTASNGSRHSRHTYLSRPRTVADETASLATNKSAEEDVCFPLQDEQTGGKLYIDFDYLENFIRAEKEASVEDENRKARGPSSAGKSFPDLRPGSAVSGAQAVTVDGDILDLPSEADASQEKQGSIQEVTRPTVQAAVDPSRISFFSSAWESTIHSADLEGLMMPGEDIRGLFTFPKGETDGVWWLNMNNPSEEEARALCRAFGVHPLTIEDITAQESREKIELFPSYYFACFRSYTVEKDAETGEKEFVPFNIYVVVFREGTLSFSYANNAHAARVRKRITALKDYVSLSSDWICYALIDDIVDSFAPAISELEQETDQIEDDVFVARTDDMAHFLRKIGNARKNVMGLMRLLGGKADVLKGFTKRCNENYKVTPRMDIGLYLGDIQDHVVTMMTNLGHFEKMLSRAHSNYLAQISIDGIIQGTSTNRVLSKITLLASIIVPLNVVTGLFGMNVRVPWQSDHEESLYAFWGILGSLFLFSAQLQQADLDRLNDKDRTELRQFLANNEQRARIQSQSHVLTDICWKKCVTGGIKGSSLDKSEQGCLANCVDRFFDVNLLTMKHLANMRQS